MRIASRLLLVLVSSLAACDPGRTNDASTTVVGTEVGVAGLPRFRGRERLLIAQCCTLANGPDLKLTVIQGIESPGYEIRGQGFKLEVSFGPYTSTEVQQEIYEPIGERWADGVRVARFRLRPEARPNYAAARHLWAAKVGGRQFGDTFHEGWGLRIAGDCTSLATCGSMLRLVSSIRF